MSHVDFNTLDFNAPYPKWGSTERLSKLHMYVTEKIDGTNGLVSVSTDGTVRAGSRTRWLTPEHDNYGFARWALEHEEELRALGTGLHYGEWWGLGIQRGYGMQEKRFSLFNARRPAETLPACVHQVPLLYSGALELSAVGGVMSQLRLAGSVAAPGFMRPEGVIVWLGRERYKVTFDGDRHKWETGA